MHQLFLENSEVFFKLMVAVLLGIAIGAERVLFHKEAGMKTHALVSLGAALFVVVSEMIAVKYSGLSGIDPTRIASQVVVGIGFLGAGAIIFQQNRLVGLTTAGGLWVTAGIGMASGFGFFNVATIATVLVLFILLVVYMFEQPIRKMSEGIDSSPDKQ